jgi:hypothetical protein
MDRLTDKYIEALSGDLKPVRPLSFRKSLALLALGTLVYGLALAFLFPPRPDLWLRLKGTAFFWLLFLPVVVTALGLVKALRSTLLGNGARFQAAYWFLPAYLLAAFLYSRAVGSGLPLVWERQDAVCALLILALSLPVWIALSSVAALFFPAHPGWEPAIALTAGAVSAFAINLHCPFDGHGHHWIGHGLGAFFLLFLFYPFFAWSSRKATALLIEGRVKRKKSALL